MAKLTAIDILNTIRDNLDTQYAERVPEATRDNIAEVGKAITTDTITLNAFIGALINKVALTNVVNKMFTNPLGRLKKASVPNLGANVEEIFVNPATDMGYQKDGNLLLRTYNPDAKVCYYGLNRQGCYPVSIRRDELSRAFTSEQSFMSLYNKLVSSMISGDQIDEFMLMKNMLGKAIDNEAVKVINDVDMTAPKEFAKGISNMSKSFVFPSTQLCGYNMVNNLNAEEAEEKGCITFCPVENQVLLIRADAQTEIDYEVLATMFHMEVAKLEAMTILVDDIPSENYDIYAVLCDESAIQVRDTLQETADFKNGANLTTTFFFHHWQYMFVSMFANMVAFGKEKTKTT